jgi:hypothetical protein
MVAMMMMMMMMMMFCNSKSSRKQPSTLQLKMAAAYCRDATPAPQASGWAALGQPCAHPPAQPAHTRQCHSKEGKTHVRHMPDISGMDVAHVLRYAALLECSDVCWTDHAKN